MTRCPKCLSEDTRRPGVLDPRWRIGSQICNSCDHQSDWLDFVSGLDPRVVAAAKRTTAPLHALFEAEGGAPSLAELNDALGEMLGAPKKR